MISVENRCGHVEVRDSAGNFLFSADTMTEAMKELEESNEED